VNHATMPVYETAADHDGAVHLREMYIEGVTQILSDEGIRFARLEMIKPGDTAVVFLVDDRLVVKMCPPLWTEKMDLEVEVLKLLGSASLPVARAVADGSFDGWRYGTYARSAVA
jgi:hypothetical protein